jgi:hypothetical protein
MLVSQTFCDLRSDGGEAGANAVLEGTNMPEMPSQLQDIAERLCRNEKLKRRTVETLLKWFGAARRGTAVTAKIKIALQAAGLETDPDFTQGSVNDFISFRLIGGVAELKSDEPAQVESEPGITPDAETAPPSSASEPSDDFLEPEDDEQQAAADDDRPVVSKPADWTITTLRDKWEDGKLDLQPQFQREYVWHLKPELPSRLIESVLLEIPIPPILFWAATWWKIRSH